ncbi:glycine-rich domain-containing protein [Massilia niabensis]|uniref:Glycine-rich domain-containing protein n=1 Tax=Massilia niabensis TaxID=544910 RepID=A0ABW0L9Z4_9BURK
MISNNDFALISALDLNPIRKKLMHVESGEGWSLEQATTVETEYRRFLYLCKTFPNEPVAPLDDVDTFWHYHILDTMKYARDCEEVFGYFLHHYPYVGMDEENGSGERHNAGERMRELYESSFGVSYVRAAGVIGERAPTSAVQTAWCTGTTDMKADAAQTACCFGTGGPGIAKLAGARTAYCIGVGNGPGMAKSA